MRSRAVTAVLLCVLAAGRASAQGAPSARERVWASTVARTVSGSSTVLPTKTDTGLVLTLSDVRVTRERTASNAAALERAKSLLLSFGRGSQVVEGSAASRSCWSRRRTPAVT